MRNLPSCEDYITSIEVPQLIKAEELNGGRVMCYKGNPVMYAGGFCVVFPYILASNKKVAVRCWTARIEDVENRSNIIASKLSGCGLPYFVNFKYIPEGIATSSGIFPIIIMDWVDAKPLKEYISQYISEPIRISNLAEQFRVMVSDMHKVSFSHGDLQHGNIMVTKDGNILLVDYDSMFVPGLENVSDEIKGLAGYQHHGRSKLKFLSPKSDYFSELIIYTSLTALSKYPQLWRQLNIENTETLLFTQKDLDSPSYAEIFKLLKKDKDLCFLIEKIEAALKETDIENLFPLEDTIIPASKRILEGLQEKWKNMKPRIKNNSCK